MNENKEYQTPRFQSEKEEQKYWESHNPLTEGYEGTVEKKKQNRASFLSVRLSGAELARLKEVAAYYGVGPSTYARQVMIQAIESGNKGGVSMAPSFLLSLFSRVGRAEGPVQPPEQVLRRLNKLYQDYVSWQDAVADAMVKAFDVGASELSIDLDEKRPDPRDISPHRTQRHEGTERTS